MEAILKLEARTIDAVSEWHLRKSKYLCKAAKCEAELRRLAATPADAKLHFKALAEKFRTTNGTAKKVALNAQSDKLLEELLPLIDLRSELAHSCFHANVGLDPDNILIKNAQDQSIHFEKVTLLSADAFKKAYDRLSWIAGQLAKI
jgi:hypothetical protein